jgi:drug/metabolite transporter (DMT)-like permease
MSDIPPPVKRRPRFWWILAELGAIVGGAILILFFPFASSAPQEASIAALAIACAVIPYCMARAVDERRDR